MVTQSAIAVEFESTEGLHIEMVLRVTDERGEADAVQQNIVDSVQSMIDKADLLAALNDLMAQDFQVVTVDSLVQDLVGDECDCEQCDGGF